MIAAIHLRDTRDCDGISWLVVQYACIDRGHDVDRLRPQSVVRGLLKE